MSSQDVSSRRVDQASQRRVVDAAIVDAAPTGADLLDTESSVVGSPAPDTPAPDTLGPDNTASDTPVPDTPTSDTSAAGGRDVAFMELAITAARRGPVMDPNPRVGCVIVPADGSAPVTGWHRGAGTAHAEADALRQAGDSARGATAYVTLEPCAHTGRTGPCADALICAGVARVVYAVADPSAAASGGARRLAEHGVSVQGGLLADAAREVNRTWLHSAELGRPFVTLKTATTLDGRVAAADGSSRWITGPEARADAHRLRAECGAILVGSGTALIDDPGLTVRDESGALVGRQPLRVVVGHRGPRPGSRLTDGSAPTEHLATHDVREVLTHLQGRGVHHVLVEGGPTLTAAFLRADLVDEVIAYLAPAILGAGPAAVADLGIVSIDDARRLTITDLRLVGADARITLRPHRRAPLEERS